MIAFEHVSKSFDSLKVLDDLSFRIGPGEILGIVGPSGAGKTTILKLITGIVAPDEGSVRVAGGAVGYVFQEPRLLPWKSVIDNVTLKHRTTDDIRRGLEILGEVGLGNHANVWPGTLSGGEAQRAALARALLTTPDLLLLDEPFAALDALTRLRMHTLIRSLIRRYSPGTLLVTHDVDEAIVLADRIFVMKDGSLSRQISIDAADRDSPRTSALRMALLTQLDVFTDETPAAA